MIVGGLLLALISAVHLAVVGLQIRKRRWWTFCYLTGWGECLMFPFGTVLGIFTIIVLARPSVKRLFGVHSFSWRLTSTLTSRSQRTAVEAPRCLKPRSWNSEFATV